MVMSGNGRLSAKRTEGWTRTCATIKSQEDIKYGIGFLSMEQCTTDRDISKKSESGANMVGGVGGGHLLIARQQSFAGKMEIDKPRMVKLNYNGNNEDTVV